MNRLTVLLIFSLFSALARASALASLYNGTQFHLEGQLLVQDSENPNDFYLIPQVYEVKRESVFNPTTQSFSERVAVNHRVFSKDGHQYSSYSIRMILEMPDQLEIQRALSALRQKVGQSARIIGAAPVCGLRLDLPARLPSMEGSSEPPYNATWIQYSIASSEAGKCNSMMDTTEFSLEYRVPLDLEPALAQNITTDVGLLLPPIELVLPYKYKDKVRVEVDAESAIQQLKAGADIKGSFKFVTGEVQANIERLVNTLQVTGQMAVDCQNPDPTICNYFLDQAKDVLAKTLYIYTPLAVGGDTNPMVLGDKEKNVDASLFKVGLAFDEQSAKRIGKFRVDFSNTVYSSIYSQVQIHVQNIPSENLDPIVRQMLQ